MTRPTACLLRAPGLLVAALLLACGGGGGGGGAAPMMTCGGTTAAAADLVRFDCPPSSFSPLPVRVVIGGPTSSDIYLVKFDVLFDPAVIAFEEPAIEGDFLNQDGNPTTVEAGPASNDPGRLVVSVTRQGSVAGVGVASGEKTIITLPFAGLARGSSALTFANAEAVDSGGAPIAAVRFSGPVDITSP